MVGNESEPMSIRSWTSERSPVDAAGASPTHGLKAEDAVAYLSDDLTTTLGNLDGAPSGIADCVVQLLPLGSRTSLLGLEIVERIADEDDDIYGLHVTPFGYEVIAAAAAHRDADSVIDWTKRATLAAEAARAIDN
jgi:hypothetical protein